MMQKINFVRISFYKSGYIITKIFNVIKFVSFNRFFWKQIKNTHRNLQQKILRFIKRFIN